MSLVPFHRPHNVAVVIDGVADGSLIARMDRDVQRVFRHIVGGWRVSVCASARGRWRLEVSGFPGRQIWIFAAPTAALSEAVVEKLEAFLRDSAAAWRPLPAGV